MQMGYLRSQNKSLESTRKLLSKNSRSSLENFGEKLMIENIGSMMKDLTTYLLKVSSKLEITTTLL